MVITATEKISTGCLKITVAPESSFFIRTSYLLTVAPEAIAEGAEFNGDAEQDLLNAGLCYSAERKAVDYLIRAEQSRFSLERKLAEKGFEKQYVARALDFLEGERYLSDERFARAWLNARKVGHCEGRRRLECELAVRGIKKTVAAAALDEFFGENSEEEICRKAVEKCRRQKVPEDKLLKKLSLKGFSLKMIEKCLKI